MPRPKDTNVLLEQVLTEVKKVAEGHETLERMISQVRQELTGQIGRLENQTSLGFREVFQRLDRVEQELGHIKQAVSETAGQLKLHQKEHAT